MPREEQRSGDHSPRAPSTKEAKERSNCLTRLALRGIRGAEDSNRRGYGCTSERDSGYSDGSDWQQTDGDDQRSNRSSSRGSEHAGTSQPNQEVGQKNTGRPGMRPRGHQPVYNDMVDQQQPGISQRRGQQHWRNGIREIDHSGSPHMGLLQHPRVAPHPSRKPPNKSNHETQNLRRRVCAEPDNDATPESTGPPEQHLHKQPKLAVSSSGLSCSSSTSPSSSPTSSSRGSPPVHSSTRGLHRNGSARSRSFRFHGTPEIIRQTGLLLDITLRTKELLRQSSSTDRDIAQLRQHTQLLSQTASSISLHQDDMTAWEHIYRVMAESGSYPNLKKQQNSLNPPSPDSTESISTFYTNRPETPDSSEVLSSHLVIMIPDQSCAVSRQPHSENGRTFEVSDETSEKVTFMLPDSSTD